MNQNKVVGRFKKTLVYSSLYGKKTRMIFVVNLKKK